MSAEVWRALVDVVVGILAIAAFFRPQPALHKQFADKADTKELLAEIKDSIKDIREDLAKITHDQAESRKIMYARINAHSSALYFMAGRMSGRGDEDGERIHVMLARAEEAE